MARPVIMVTSEIFPFSKTGGLGDVLGALPLALHKRGVPVSVITPLYGRLSTGRRNIRLTVSDLPVGYPWGPITADALETTLDGMPVYFIDRGEYFDRKSYYNTHKGDYFDNAERFIFFCRAALALMRRLGEPPAIVHSHDWQSALLAAFIHYYRAHDPFWASTSTVFTVHNLAFQGRFSNRLFESSGLPAESWNMSGVEFYGDFNMLKGALNYADKITTVSPSYAEEILTEEFGYGMDGVLRWRQSDLLGILNGADYDVWNPETSVYLPANYSRDDMSGKKICKDTLVDELGLMPHMKERPMFGFIGRLRDQKGIDLLNTIVPALMDKDVSVVVLGEGKAEYEAWSLDLMESYRGRYAAVVEYTEEYAHKIQAGCDCFLMPSRYEPCGLTQMYALRYGSPPVATRVGGLIDTIKPWPAPDATGFMFECCTTDSLLEAILSALALWEQNQEEWRSMVYRAMGESFTWDKAAARYEEIYKELGLQR